MNKFVALSLFGLILLSHGFVSAQDSEAEDAEVAVEEEGEGGEGEVSTESTEELNEDGKKELTLEDLQLWSSIDMDKDGTLTIGEFDRFIRSPQARTFVKRMKDEKAIQQWADKVGIDVAKAKQAMALGAQAQSRAAAQQARSAHIVNTRRQQQAAAQAGRRRQQVQQSKMNNYFANLGRRYFRAMSGKRRDEL